MTAPAQILQLGYDSSSYKSNVFCMILNYNKLLVVCNIDSFFQNTCTCIATQNHVRYKNGVFWINKHFERNQLPLLFAVFKPRWIML